MSPSSIPKCIVIVLYNIYKYYIREYSNCPAHISNVRSESCVSYAFRPCVCLCVFYVYFTWFTIVKGLGEYIKLLTSRHIFSFVCNLLNKRWEIKIHARREIRHTYTISRKIHWYWWIDKTEIKINNMNSSNGNHIKVFEIFSWSNHNHHHCVIKDIIMGCICAVSDGLGCIIWVLSLSYHRDPVDTGEDRCHIEEFTNRQRKVIYFGPS